MKSRYVQFTVIFSLTLASIICSLGGAVAYSAPFSLDNVPPVIDLISAPAIDSVFIADSLSLSWNILDGHQTETIVQLYDDEDILRYEQFSSQAHTSLMLRVPEIPAKEAELVLEVRDEFGNARAIYLDDSFIIDYDLPRAPQALTVQRVGRNIHLNWLPVVQTQSGIPFVADSYVILKAYQGDPLDMASYRVIGVSHEPSFIEIAPRDYRRVFYRVKAIYNRLPIIGGDNP